MRVVSLYIVDQGGVGEKYILQIVFESAVHNLLPREE